MSWGYFKSPFTLVAVTSKVIEQASTGEVPVNAMSGSLYLEWNHCWAGCHIIKDLQINSNHNCKLKIIIFKAILWSQVPMVNSNFYLHMHACFSHVVSDILYWYIILTYIILTVSDTVRNMCECVNKSVFLCCETCNVPPMGPVCTLTAPVRSLDKKGGRRWWCMSSCDVLKLQLICPAESRQYIWSWNPANSVEVNADFSKTDARE